MFFNCKIFLVIEQSHSNFSDPLIFSVPILFENMANMYTVNFWMAFYQDNMRWWTINKVVPGLSEDVWSFTDPIIEQQKWYNSSYLIITL